ncbi:MAG TPA: hypothetical protein EYO62_06050 [Aquificales bacterium]|nr:hypothetical protein [Aquificales bacterium]
MRFRKYSRKHAFNILYQWDITGEPLEEVKKNYWKHLEEVYKNAANLAEDLLRRIESGEEVNVELYSKKFETLADEEIMAERLRKKLYTVYLLLKAAEEFHNFTLTFTGWISERSRAKLQKAKEILAEIKRILETVKGINGEDRERIEELEKFVLEVEENPPQDFDTLRELEERFRQKVFELSKTYLREIKDFATKRVNEDMGEIKEYAERLLTAYKEHQIEVDSTIEEFLKDWTLDSLGSVERNLLRLGTAEFMYVGVQDPGRAFNDYIDFAKAFVGKKAAKFVNGVLSAIYNKKVAAKGGETKENPSGGEG